MDFRIEHHHYFHRDPEEADRLAGIEAKLDRLITRQATFRREVMADLTGIAAEVEQMESVQDGAVALLDNITALLEAAKNDPAEVQAIVDRVRSQRTELAEAIVRNTPADDGGEPADPDPADPADEGEGGVPA